MLQIRRILCPVDLSDTSLRALRHASALARWYEASLTAFTVDTTRPIESVADFEDFVVAGSAAVAAGPSRALQDVRSFVARAGCESPVDTVVAESTAVGDSIVERARILPADLIVIGSHGRSGVTRLLLGSVAEHVLRAAPCPVMVVPPHDEVPPSVVAFKHIVCAVDFSESSLAAVAWAVSLAEEADAHLWLFHAVEVPPELRVSTAVTDRQIDEMHAAVRADTLVQLRSLVPSRAPEFCSVETATEWGAAGRAILDLAAEKKADLIVMGAQGHGALDRFIFGSKTRDVVRGARCPVLTVRR